MSNSFRSVGHIYMPTFYASQTILQNLNNGTIDSTTARNGPFFTSNEQVGFFGDQCFQNKIFCVFHLNLTLRPFFRKAS